MKHAAPAMPTGLQPAVAPGENVGASHFLTPGTPELEISFARAEPIFVDLFRNANPDSVLQARHALRDIRHRCREAIQFFKKSSAVTQIPPQMQQQQQQQRPGSSGPSAGAALAGAKRPADGPPLVQPGAPKRVASAPPVQPQHDPRKGGRPPVHVLPGQVPGAPHGPVVNLTGRDQAGRQAAQDRQAHIQANQLMQAQQQHFLRNQQGAQQAQAQQPVQQRQLNPQLPLPLHLQHQRLQQQQQQQQHTGPPPSKVAAPPPQRPPSTGAAAGPSASKVPLLLRPRNNAALSVVSEMEFIEKTLNPNLLLVKGLTMADSCYRPPRLGDRTVFLYDLYGRVERAGGFAQVSRSPAGWTTISCQYDVPPGTEGQAPTVLRNIYDKYLLSLQLKREHARDILKLQEGQRVLAAAVATSVAEALSPALPAAPAAGAGAGEGGTKADAASGAAPPAAKAATGAAGIGGVGGDSTGPKAS